MNRNVPLTTPLDAPSVLGPTKWVIATISPSVQVIVNNILRSNQPIDFHALLWTTVSLTQLLSVLEILDKKLPGQDIYISFIEFLSAYFFHKNISFPIVVQQLLWSKSIFKKKALFYIEKRNKEITSNQNHLQQEEIAFHLALLGIDEDFDLMKDIHFDNCIAIDTILSQSSHDVSDRIGQSKIDGVIEEDFLIEINCFVELGETINKLALIYSANFDDRELIVTRLALAMEREISIIMKHIEGITGLKKPFRKLQYLLGRTWSNFAHGHAIVGNTEKEIDTHIGHIHEKQYKGYLLKIASGFWYGTEEEIENDSTLSVEEKDNIRAKKKEREKSNELILLGNQALPVLIGIDKKEALIDNNTPSDVYEEERKKQIKKLIFIYYTSTWDTISDEEISKKTPEDLVYHFIKNDANQNEYHIETILYILKSLKKRALLDLFSYLVQKKPYTSFSYEEFKIKAIGVILQKIIDSAEFCEEITPANMALEYIHNYKNTSHSILSYSRLYLTLSAFYARFGEEMEQKRTMKHNRMNIIEERDNWTDAKNCYLFYLNLTKNYSLETIANGPVSLEIQRQNTYFLAAIGRHALKENGVWEGHRFLDEELVRRGWKFIYDFQREYNQDLIIDIASDFMILIDSIYLNGDFGGNIISRINNDLCPKISKELFYGICDVHIFEDCDNCNRKMICPQTNDDDNEICQSCRLNNRECSKCTRKRGFWKEELLLDGYRLQFQYPLASQDIFLRIFDSKKPIIEKQIGNLIRTNLKNIQLLSSEKAREQLDYFDALTGLPNKNSLLADIAKLITVGKKPLLILLKFDQITSINDGLGFDKWDSLLNKISGMLTPLNETLSMGVIYRTGGSEFGILIHHYIKNEELSIEGVAKNLIDMIMKTSVELSENEIFYFTPSIGIGSSGGERMYDKAHAALQEAREGMGLYKIYEVGVAEARIQEEFSIKSTIETALRNNEVTVAFQEICANVKTNTSKKKIRRKLEALIRVPRLSPWKLIEVAKKHGLLPWLTHKVIERTLQAAQGNNHQFSINITEENLRDPDFISDLTNLLDVYQVAATRLCIEITEDVINIGKTGYIEKLIELDLLGCEFSIDDFGMKSAGWDLVRYLKDRLKNLCYLKIDGSFIKDIVTNSFHESVVIGITNTAHNIGLKVVAEFVETEKTQKKIEELGIDYSQWYLFSVPSAEISK